jgi:hypothetical protein
MSIRLTGRIAQLYVRQEITYIMLDNIPSNGPKDNIFGLRLDFANYSAMYSLALAAAANRWPITVRIIGSTDISPEREAFVNYLVVNWTTADD